MDGGGAPELPTTTPVEAIDATPQTDMGATGMAESPIESSMAQAAHSAISSNNPDQGLQDIIDLDLEESISTVHENSTNQNEPPSPQPNSNNTQSENNNNPNIRKPSPFADPNRPTLEELQDRMSHANTLTNQTVIDNAGNEYPIWETPDGQIQAGNRRPQVESNGQTQKPKPTHEQPIFDQGAVKPKPEMGDDSQPQDGQENQSETLKPEEIKPNPESYQATQALVSQVQEIINQSHGLKDISSASDMVWDESDQSLSDTIRKPLMDYAGAGTYGLSTPEGEHLGSIIHFPPEMMDRLAHANVDSLLKGSEVTDMLALIEETSHYSYMENYYNKYGEMPNSANVELVGVVDKINVMQALFIKNYGRPMNAEESATAMRTAASAHEMQNWSGDRREEYIVGHQLGRDYTYFLNGLHNMGVDAAGEMSAFYNASNKDQIEHLLYNVGLQIDIRTPGEKEAVGRLLQNLGVKAFYG